MKKRSNWKIIALGIVITTMLFSLLFRLTSTALKQNDGNNSIENTWLNKKAVFIGDSITAGVGTTTGNRYFEFLDEEIGFSTVRSYGISGSCVSTTSDYGTNNTPLINRWESIANSNLDANLLVIFMGTNDYGHSTPLSTITDTSDVSFFGALNVVLSGLKSKLPNTTICWITPLHRCKSGVVDTTFNGVGNTLQDYTNAIISVCTKYNISYFNSFDIKDFNPSTDSIKETYFPDGLHPNALGHSYLAKNLLPWLNKL